VQTSQPAPAKKPSKYRISANTKRFNTTTILPGRTIRAHLERFSLDIFVHEKKS